jgi:perosamine synthetase
MKRIPVAGPWITDAEVRAVADAAATAWYADHARYHQQFEQAMADYLQVAHAVTVPHCTSAIHLGLAALDIGPGDEVIVPDLTWIASAAPVKYVGATTVFADVDPVTWCLDPANVERCITPRTRAIICVDLYGGMPDYTSLRSIASRHGIAIIEDAAEAIGSCFHGKPAGSLGDVGVFSFHGSKTLTTGEGGLLATDDASLFDRVLHLRDHGRPPGDRHFNNTTIAFKYKMSAMQAAMGLAQLQRIEELVGRKRDIFRWYDQRLREVPYITLNAEPSGIRNSYWMTTAILHASSGMDKERLMGLLDERGIDSRPMFRPLSSLPAYSDDEQARVAMNRNRNAYAIAPYGINLPSSLCLQQPDIDRVCDALLEILDQCALSEADAKARHRPAEHPS